MNILLTGASGFLGRALVPIFSNQGDNLTLICRSKSAGALVRTLADHRISAEIIEAEPVDWGTVVKNRVFDLCVHAAWIATPNIYLNSSENEQFVRSTLNLAETLMASGLPHFLGIGTGIEYAPNQTKPCNEIRTPAVPSFPYSIAKCRTHHLLEKLIGNKTSVLTWARIFYPYGKGEHPERIATSFFQNLIAGRPVELKNPESRKDFIEISDAASAIAHLAKMPPQGTINIGTGISTSIRELATLAAKIVGSDASLVRGTMISSDDPYSYHIADISKLLSTRWSPSVSLEEGMRKLFHGLLEIRI